MVSGRHPRGSSARALGLFSVAMLLLVFLAAPMVTLGWRSVLNASGTFVGLANYSAYFTSPDLLRSALNTLRIGVITTAVTVPLAYCFAFALSHTQMRFKRAFTFIGLLPLLAPSLLPAIALIYLLGNKGLLRELLPGVSVYGPFGLTVALAFTLFPHVLLILLASMERLDGRLYEAASTLRASQTRIFLSVTLPATGYGLLAAATVAFVFAVTDFGAAKVVGGWYSVLSVDIYRKVIGQADLEMGSVVSVVLLVPVVLMFTIRIVLAGPATAQFLPQSVPLSPSRRTVLDVSATIFCGAVSLFIAGIIATGAFASFVRFWPYDLSLSLRNYTFPEGSLFGWQAYRNSLAMAVASAVIGTAFSFAAAYLVETTQGFAALRRLISLAALLPMAIPGMVIGLSYVLFFGNSGNPLTSHYNTLGILVTSTVIHHYTVPHLAILTALRKLDRTFGEASLTLRASEWRYVATVVVPLCLPTMLNVFFYFFVCGLTTVSAVIFLSGPGTYLASLAVVSMENQGNTGSAAAMAMLILYTAAVVRLLQAVLTRLLLRRAQALAGG